MIKKLALFGASVLCAANIASAGEDFTSLSGVDATALSGTEMASVEGKAHGNFPLGALLIANANPKLFDTPAWNTKGLHPVFGPAMGKARVGPPGP